MKRKVLCISAILMAACLGACGKSEATSGAKTEESSVVVETEEDNQETAVSAEATETEDSEAKEESSDFFAIRQITDLSNEMPEGIYSPDETSSSFTDDLNRYREKGYTMYTEADTWPMLDDDYYKETFPYTIIENSGITNEGTEFKEMVENAGYKMKEKFAGEELYAGHENESCCYAFSENENRACVMYYDAKEKSVNVMLFQLIARKESKSGSVTDYYFTQVTGAKTEGLNADEFYKSLGALGIGFDGEVKPQEGMEVIPGGARTIKSVSQWRVDGTGDQYSATDRLVEAGFSADSLTITNDVCHTFVNNNVSNISIREEFGYLSYDQKVYASLDEYFAAYKELFIYEGKDARNYFQYLVSDKKTCGVSIYDTSYTGKSKDAEVTLYQQVGTAKKSDTGEELPVYRKISFHLGEGGLADEFYNRLSILGINLVK
ncbi:MAG: hypothetical protein K6E48_09410 [Lachnospiraceae bacterium]|nr:hypothetical protein [Lachnospiraceae bacterium]